MVGWDKWDGSYGRHTGHLISNQSEKMFRQSNSLADEQQKQQFQQQKMEIAFTTNMFNKMVKNCFRKCVPKLTEEPDLNVAEMTCVDRCVSKYMKFHAIVGTEMNKANTQAQTQQGGMPVAAGQ